MARLQTLCLLLALSGSTALATAEPPETIFPINQSLALEYDAIASKNFRLPHQTRESAAEFRARQKSGSPVEKGKVLHTLEPILRLRSITVESSLLLRAAADGFPVRMSLFSDASYLVDLEIHTTQFDQPNRDFTILRGTLVDSGKRGDIGLRIDGDGSVTASYFIGSQRFNIDKTPPHNYQFAYERTSLDAKNPLDNLNSVLDTVDSPAGKAIALEMSAGFAECLAYYRVMQMKAQLAQDESKVKHWGSEMKFMRLMLQATVGKQTAQEMSIERTKEMLDDIDGEIARTDEIEQRYPNQVEKCRMLLPR